MADLVELSVDGQNHGGWTTISITRSIETIAGTFHLGLSDRWPGSAGLHPIGPGSACTLSIGGEVIITGYVDDGVPSFDPSSHVISVSGRDATGDLVDCSATNEPGEWKNRNLTQITQALCKPFEITVSAAVNVGKPFTSFRIEEGETVFEAIERACRMRAVLPVSDGKGGLILTRASEAVRTTTGLTSGENGNVLSGGGKFSMKDRYSTIIVKGQQAGTDYTSPTDNAEPFATATDPNVPRYRPLIVLAEDQGDAETFKQRALWEASVRRARGLQATIPVQGWRTADGSLWQPKTLIDTIIPELGINAEMLITSVNFTLSKQGSLSSLGLAPPKAFELIEIAEEEDKEIGW